MSDSERIKRLKRSINENRKLLKSTKSPYGRDSIRNRINILKSKIKELSNEL